MITERGTEEAEVKGMTETGAGTETERDIGIATGTETETEIGVGTDTGRTAGPETGRRAGLTGLASESAFGKAAPGKSCLSHEAEVP